VALGNLPLLHFLSQLSHLQRSESLLILFLLFLLQHPAGSSGWVLPVCVLCVSVFVQIFNVLVFFLPLFLFEETGGEIQVYRIILLISLFLTYPDIIACLDFSYLFPLF
jgi:hypothetical protein